MPIEPEDLLPYFERELALLRRSMQTFAQKFSKIAARLAISGEHSDDPHVERMLQWFALMAARHDLRLDDDVPGFTHALINTLHGTFLRPFPSCAIVQFGDELIGTLTAPRTIARGTQLLAPASRAVFRTTCDVVLAPLRLTSLRYTTTAVAPIRASLPPETTGLLSFVFELPEASATFAMLPDTVRLHLTGPREVVAALADGVLINTARAWVEPDGSGTWKRLQDDVPLSAGSLNDVESLLTMPDNDALKPFHLLMEYCAFPARFDFLDLNAMLLKRAAGSARRVALHLALTDVHPDSHRAQRLSVASADNVRLFCTPVVNLFTSDATPIETRAGLSFYPVRPLSAKTAAVTQIWSVDEVRQSEAQGTAVLPPFESLQHGNSASHSLYWTLLRDEDRRAPRTPETPLPSGQMAHNGPASGSNSTDARRGLELAFVGLNSAPADPGRRQLAIMLSCTNGDLSGMPERSLTQRDGDPAGSITLLAPPGASHQPSFRHGELWEFLSLLAPQTVRLDTGGLDQLRRLCARFSMPSSDAGRRFDALVSLSSVRVRRWIPGQPVSGFMQGLEVTLVVDEQRFLAFSVATLGHVVDRFFAPYAPANSFVQVVLVSASNGSTIRRGSPQAGATPVV